MNDQRTWTNTREFAGLKYFEVILTFFIVFFIFIPIIKLRLFKKYKPNKKEKKSILIYGAYGNRSVGDDAILQSILENFDPEKYDITISSFRPYLTSKTTNYKVIWQGRTLDGLFYMYKSLRNTDLLIFGGGGVLETHNNSFRTSIAMMYKLSKVFLAKIMGVKVYCFAIGSNIKPYSYLVKLLVSTLLDCVDGISTRDENSYKFLKKIKSDLNISSLADPALLLSTKVSHQLAEDIRVGINVMPYYKLLEGDVAKLNTIRDEIAKGIDQIITQLNAKVYFIPMVEVDDTEEQEFIFKKIKNQDKVILLQPNYDPIELMDLLSSLDVFIGTRLHPNILSFNMNTPIIGIAYHDKIHSLFSQINLPNYVISIQDISSQWLSTRVFEIIENKKDIKSLMKEQQNNLIPLAKKSFEEVSNLLNE